MGTEKEIKIKKYHSDEIKLILFLSQTDLSKYDREDLKIFAECIEGRIEVLFEPNYLNTIQDFLPINEKIKAKIGDLRKEIQNLYSGQWYLKMASQEWRNLFKQSNLISSNLKLEYQDPMEFMTNNFEIDW